MVGVFLVNGSQHGSFLGRGIRHIGMDARESLGLFRKDANVLRNGQDHAIHSRLRDITDSIVFGFVDKNTFVKYMNYKCRISLKYLEQ